MLMALESYNDGVYIDLKSANVLDLELVAIFSLLLMDKLGHLKGWLISQGSVFCNFEQLVCQLLRRM